MKKLLFIIPVLFLVAACDPGYSDLSAKYSVLPEELKDCKIYRLQGDGTGSMAVMRCPLSTTSVTYMEGKTQVTTATIDENPPVVSKEQKECEEDKGEYIITKHNGSVCVKTETIQRILY